jgi:hypothetical protein
VCGLLGAWGGPALGGAAACKASRAATQRHCAGGLLHAALRTEL